MADPGAALIATIAAFHRRGWCLATSGNFSVVLEHRPPRLLITPSGADKSRLEARDLLAVDGDGAPIDHAVGARRPSAETLLHCAVVAATGAGAVLHTHSVDGTLLGEHFLARGGLTISGYEMQKGLEGVASHEDEVYVPVLANRQDMPRLAAEVRDLLAQRPATHGFLIAGHGLYTWGADLDQARRHVEALEFLFACLARRLWADPLTSQR